MTIVVQIISGNDAYRKKFIDVWSYDIDSKKYVAGDRVWEQSWTNRTYGQVGKIRDYIFDAITHGHTTTDVKNISSKRWYIWIKKMSFKTIDDFNKYFDNIKSNIVPQAVNDFWANKISQDVFSD